MQVHNEIIRTIARNCNAFGISEEQVYEKAGITKESVSSDEGMQNWRTGIRIWEAAAGLTGYPHLALHFGKKITFSVLGWIAPLTSSSKDLFHAWKTFADFFPLMGDMFRYEVQQLKDDQVKVKYIPGEAWIAASPQTAALAAEHAMALTLSLSGFLACKQVQCVRASFLHQPAANVSAPYTDLFGMVLFGQDEYSLVFDKHTAALPVISANKIMYEHMLKLCSMQLKQLNASATLKEKVWQLLHRKEAYYLIKIEEAAAMLNMSARTLQRKLKEEQTSFHELVEQYQVDMAKQLLEDENHAVQDVAFVLGYQSQQSFSRAFKRKAGHSPTAYKTLSKHLQI